MIERVETQLGWQFIQIYGLTETSPLLTINRAPPEWAAFDVAERARAVARGRAGGRRPDRVDEQGEILARSNTCSRATGTNRTRPRRPSSRAGFHTGDGGAMEGAYVVISDRKKDVIITGGENVSSIEVEDCLYQHPAVAEAAVIGVPDERWGETVKALVVLRAGAQPRRRKDVIDSLP